MVSAWVSQGAGQEEPEQPLPLPGRGSAPRARSTEKSHTGHRQAPPGLALGLPAAEHLPDEGVLPGEQAVLLGDGRVAGGTVSAKIPASRWGWLRAPAASSKKEKGRPLVQQAQGKVKVRSRHIPTLENALQRAAGPAAS